MKGLFKSKPRTPAELVCHVHDLLILVSSTSSDLRPSKRHEDKMSELRKLILEMRTVLYGDDRSEPITDTCSKLTLEFFKGDTLRLIITCLPKLDLGAASEFKIDCFRLHGVDLLDVLIPGYEDSDIALSYGAILRDCIRHQVVARYVLESEHVVKFFDYIQNPNFDIASDVSATFKELLTRHRSTVAEFLSKNYDWFFQEYNSQLLESTNYITRRNAVKLLGAMLLDRSNSAVMVRYVSSLDNMRILMNLLRDSNRTIQLDAFHVFKLFAANQHKPAVVVNVLVANRSKLLRLFEDLKVDKEDEQFEADKAEVVKEIAILESRNITCAALNQCEIRC